MTDVIIPPWLRVSSADWRLIGNAAAYTSPLSGATRTYSRPGDRWGVQLSIANAKDVSGLAERSYVATLVAALRNRANRVWLSPPGYVRRGSFPASELTVNGDFSNGTTGWDAGINWNITVQDRVARVTRKVNSGGTEIDLLPQSYPSVTQYAPYVGRGFVSALSGAADVVGGYLASGIAADGTGLLTGPGMRTQPLLAIGTTAASYLYQNSAVQEPFTYFESPYMSLSRCALVDNGQNLVTYSDQLNNAAWSKVAASVVADNSTAPDGTSSGASRGDGITPDTSNAQHYISRAVTVTAAANWYCVSGAFKPNGYNFVVLYMSTASGEVYQSFNVSTGAVGSTGVTGTGWANRRSVIMSLGNGWYYCALLAFKTSAETTINDLAFVSNADSVAAFTGNGTSGVYAWRLGFAQSGSPGRLAQTVATATTTSGTSQTGSTMRVKGLPASTNGLLLAGDFVQVGNQLLQATSPLNSDAAGLGVLQFAPSIRTPPADNAPVIVHEPMGRFLLSDDTQSYSMSPGRFSDFSFDLIEDVT